MAHHVAFGGARFGMPAWTIAAAVAGVESQSADGAEDMATFGVDGDPFAGTGFSVIHEFAAGHGFVEKSGVNEHIRRGAGAIVARSIIDITMTAAVDIGFTLQAIACGDSAMNHLWCGFWSYGILTSKDDGATVNKLVLIGTSRLGRTGDTGVFGFATAETQCEK